jgi:hypothetical protein
VAAAMGGALANPEEIDIDGLANPEEIDIDGL